MNKWDLLSLLREQTGDKYISGEKISQNFNVTRAAVWKCVNELKKLGYEIESKTNNGYKIILPQNDNQDNQILNEYEISSRLQKKDLKLNYDVIYKKSTDSTNNDAKGITGKNNLLIVTEKQTAGKGRYGRSFYSDNNNGIYFTIKISHDNISLNIDDITFFPLIAAVSASKAVSDLCGIELSIKWPNDLLFKLPPSLRDTPLKEGGKDSGYKKICGILTEASIEAENRSVSYVIVGIGLNVNNDLTEFPDDIKDIASSLKIISGKKYNRADIISETVNIFTQFLFMPRELSLDEYRKRLLTGNDISFAQNGRIFKGKAVGITNTGNLIARLENGEETIIQSGEINFI